MPIVDSKYSPGFFFKNGFVSTVYSGLVRKVSSDKYKSRRKRYKTKDNDFIDLDWSYCGSHSDKLLILLHGLEGSADRPYMLGTSNLFNANGYDCLRINFRGCSGEDNLQYRSYHSGDTEDLAAIINDISKHDKYKHIYLNGYSLGGNVILKYLGEDRDFPTELKGAVAVSVPCDLKGSAHYLLKFNNLPYAIRFKRHLLKRLKLKQQRFPDKIKDEDIKKIKTLIDFDDQYTAKAHGFKDANDYYEQSSSLQFLKNIKLPSLIINSLNDSFLSPECYPVKQAKNNPQLYLEMPQYGGHVGFHKKGGFYYNELRALEFIEMLEKEKEIKDF